MSIADLAYAKQELLRQFKSSEISVDAYMALTEDIAVIERRAR